MKNHDFDEDFLDDDFDDDFLMMIFLINIRRDVCGWAILEEEGGLIEIFKDQSNVTSTTFCAKPSVPPVSRV